MNFKLIIVCTILFLNMKKTKRLVFFNLKIEIMRKYPLKLPLMSNIVNNA